MNIGIIGLPQTGKKTLFQLLTQYKMSEKDLVSNKTIKAIAEIRDPRFDKLAAIYKPKKEVRARIEMELLPKIEKDTISKGDIFKDIAELEAICHVVRTFKDESVYHVEGSIDPRRDIETVNSELILNDLLFIEKRLERIDKNLKRVNDAQAEKEKALLIKFKDQLDKGLPLRLLDIEKEEEKIILSYPFITLKKMIVVLNVNETDIHNATLLNELKSDYKSIDLYLMQVCAKTEAEIASLDSEAEKKEFLDEAGIKEPAINVLTRLCIKALNLISFFTVGSDEVRQWPIPAGSSAPEAAGAIHTDMQQGFIRAEVTKYEDFIELGSEAKVKEAGKAYLKGKDYIVEDGDMLGIRFNV